MKQILDQLLGSGKGWLEQGGEKRKGQLQGALAGGALGMLLGHRKVNKYAGKIAALGGAAALGGLALKLYQDWQAGQAGTGGGSPPQPLATLEGEALDQRAALLVRAMIAAARADGHIDETERQRISDHLSELGLRDTARYIDGELARALDPHALAREVTDMEQATEIYFASLLAIEVDHFMERGYLDELARALRLDPDLKGRIEQQVAAL